MGVSNLFVLFVFVMLVVLAEFSSDAAYRINKQNHTVIRVSCFFFVGVHFVIVGFLANTFFIKEECFFWDVLGPFSEIIVCVRRSKHIDMEHLTYCLIPR